MNNLECQCQIFEGDQGWCPVHGDAKHGKKVATLQQSKSELWDHAGVRESRYPVDPNFYWLTQTCDIIHPTAMNTPHLFNALKMIWNNVCPKQFRILPFREWGGIPQWDTEVRRKAIRNLLNELMNRNDRTQGMNDALNLMMHHLQKWGEKLLR
jgi:hypothetical protein